MGTPKNRSRTTEKFERALKERDRTQYKLRLYVTGLRSRSVAAIRSVREICETHLKGRYELEVIDVTNSPTLAKGEQIIAAPTLIRRLPLPLRRLIGDMADKSRVLLGLDLRPSNSPHASRAPRVGEVGSS